MYIKRGRVTSTDVCDTFHDFSLSEIASERHTCVTSAHFHHVWASSFTAHVFRIFMIFNSRFLIKCEWKCGTLVNVCRDFRLDRRKQTDLAVCTLAVLIERQGVTTKPMCPTCERQRARASVGGIGGLLGAEVCFFDRRMLPRGSAVGRGG